MSQISFAKKAGRFLFLLVLVNLVGYIASAYMTPDTMIWYNTLPQSSLTPPQYTFIVVWSVLLLLQAIAAFLVWGKASPRYFVLQLALNMLWSFVFFYLRNPALALTIVLLFVWSLIMNIKAFIYVKKSAGWLLVPTLLWALFAVYLNCIIVFS